MKIRKPIISTEFWERRREEHKAKKIIDILTVITSLNIMINLMNKDTGATIINTLFLLFAILMVISYRKWQKKKKRQ